MTVFAASRRVQLVHRVRSAETVTYCGETRLKMIGLCGGASIDAFAVEDPAVFGGVCERCDALFFGAAVYRCYSADGQLLYIGSCALWSSREALHEARTPWWPEVARVDREPQPNLGTAKRVERAAIRAEAPLYNKQHNVKRFRKDGHVFVPVAEAA